MKIAVLGYIVRGPLGGLVWHHFQYVYGLYQMGHDVLFVEDSEEYPSCYNPETCQMTTDPTYGLNFIKKIFSKFNIQNHWAYFDYHTNQWFGQSKSNIISFLHNADIVLNLSGINPLRDWTLTIPKRVFIDTDPVFTQIRHLTNLNAQKIAKQHNVFFSFGENFGNTDCSIPDDGFNWMPTRQPVILNLWKNIKKLNSGIWTTVMQWDSYKTQNWKGESFGMKSKTFNMFRNLPQKVSEKFELALGSETAPKKELEKLGWIISDPLQVTRTPFTYKEFINQSKGEWSIAKHGYVISNSGWFSERSAVYLASGKPVVIQDTGFSKFIPTGKGVLAFTNLDEAIDAIEKVENDYDSHCHYAHQIAKEYFNAELVLKDMLEKIEIDKC